MILRIRKSSTIVLYFAKNMNFYHALHSSIIELICHDRYEGLVLSVGGNGRSYVLILEAGPSGDPSQSRLYFARISTKVGFCRVRIISP